MPVGAAIAASTVASAGIGYLGSKSAAKTQAQAATEAGQYQLEAAKLAAQLQLGMFNTIRGDFSPYRGIGSAAIPGYMALLGLPAPTTGGTTGGQTDAGLMVPGINAPASSAARVGDVRWDQVLKDRPDVVAEYNKVKAVADPNSPWYTEHGLDRGAEGFAQWWYGNKPANDTYQAPTWTQEDIDKLGQTPATGTGTPGATPAGPALDASGIQAYLESLPGYKFVRDQGIKGITNQMSAKGLGGISGPMAKGIARFVTGLADQTYADQLARIGSAVATGQNAAAQVGGFGTQAASGASGALTQGAQSWGNAITGAANAQAAGTIGAANAISGGAQGLSNAYLTSRILGMYGG